MLAVYPSTCGYAYVLFEKHATPVDWGTREVPNGIAGRNANTLVEVTALLDRFHPDVLVIEDATAVGSRRSSRIRRLGQSLLHVAQTRSVDVEQIPRRTLIDTFANVGAQTKYEIGQAIATQFPEFGYRLPQKRRPWESEQAAMSLFSAAALGVAFYARPEVDPEG